MPFFPSFNPQAEPAADVGRFRRIEGDDPRGAIVFLPWHTGFATARRLNLVRQRGWRLCYELPFDMVCADPDRCANAITALVADVMAQVHRCGAPRLVIGLSLGTVPATIVAGKTGSRLWSIASADRGDLMIWQSRAVREVRIRAERGGAGPRDFARALRGLNPVDWAARVHEDSHFAVGMFDRYIPRKRSEPLLREAARRVPVARLRRLPLGHFGLIGLSPLLQRRWRA